MKDKEQFVPLDGKSHIKIGAMISANNMKKVQAVHDFMGELGAACGEKETTEDKSLSPLKFAKLYEMGPAEYAMSESWNIIDAANALVQMANLSRAEVGEPGDINKICNIMRGIVDFIGGQIGELEQAALEAGSKSAGTSNTASLSTTQSFTWAVPIDHKELNLSYVKSIGLESTRSMAVKYIAKDEIKGYTFLWGSPSLTDVEVEYFTKDSNFWDDKLGKSARPLTWDHAQDKDFKASPVIGDIVDFGDDELGRWYVAKLDTAHQYRKAIDALIKKGVLGTSSDSAPQYVVREQTGKSIWLKEWPWFASALTNTPAEPRMIGSLEFLKSLGVQLPDVDATRQRFEHQKRQAEVLKLKLYER